MRIESTSLENLDEVSQQIISKLDQHKVLLFYGEMGAGKTTLIKNMCKLLGVIGEVNSPTFALVNEYEIKGKKELIFHFDFYRLEDEEEAMDMGYEEYFYSDNFCFVEWPEKIPNLLPEGYLSIKIEQTDKGRIYKID